MNLSIITGPAGSGKTTTLRSLTNTLDKNGIKYTVSSFMGKAARARQL